MWPNSQKTADLVTFTHEILNGKLHFLFSRSYKKVNSFKPIPYLWSLSIPPENMMFSGGIEIDLWHEMGYARKERFRSDFQKVPKALEFVEIIYSNKFKNKQSFNSQCLMLNLGTHNSRIMSTTSITSTSPKCIEWLEV